MTQLRAMQLGALAAGASFALTALVMWAVGPALASKPAAKASTPETVAAISVPMVPSPRASATAGADGAAAGQNLRITEWRLNKWRGTPR